MPFMIQYLSLPPLFLLLLIILTIFLSFTIAHSCHLSFLPSLVRFKNEDYAHDIPIDIAGTTDIITWMCCVSGDVLSEGVRDCECVSE